MDKALKKLSMSVDVYNEVMMIANKNGEELVKGNQSNIVQSLLNEIDEHKKTIDNLNNSTRVTLNQDSLKKITMMQTLNVVDQDLNDVVSEAIGLLYNTKREKMIESI